MTFEQEAVPEEKKPVEARQEDCTVEVIGGQVEPIEVSNAVVVVPGEATEDQHPSQDEAATKPLKQEEQDDKSNGPNEVAAQPEAQSVAQRGYSHGQKGKLLGFKVGNQFYKICAPASAAPAAETPA